MAKHTPGPWKVEYDDLCEDDGCHKILMGSCLKDRAIYQGHHIIEYGHALYPEDGEPFREAQANAALIAASPEMHGTLAEVHVGLQRYIEDHGDYNGRLVGLMKQIDDVLALAACREGGAT